jgi:hypothetical protein
VPSEGCHRPGARNPIGVAFGATDGACAGVVSRPEWLAERRRAGVSLLIAGLTVLVLVVLPRRETAISLFDGCALVLLAYLLGKTDDALVPPDLEDDKGTVYRPVRDHPLSSHGTAGPERPPAITGVWRYQPLAPNSAAAFEVTTSGGRWRLTPRNA